MSRFYGVHTFLLWPISVGPLSNLPIHQDSQRLPCASIEPMFVQYKNKALPLLD